MSNVRRRVPYLLFLRDNHSWMVGSSDRLFPASACPACSVCGYRTDVDFTSSNFVLRQKRYDLSCCYDGAVIVSAAFQELCVTLGVASLVFEPLHAAPGFSHLKCSSLASLDYDAMGTERKRYCTACNRFRDFVGFSRIVVRPGSMVPSGGLAFSDERFGSNNEAAPLVLVGDVFFEKLLTAKLTGIESHERFDA
jgi:hypothetical protein